MWIHGELWRVMESGFMVDSSSAVSMEELGEVPWIHIYIFITTASREYSYRSEFAGSEIFHFKL